jgi:hypothetical protein
MAGLLAGLLLKLLLSPPMLLILLLLLLPLRAADHCGWHCED